MAHASCWPFTGSSSSAAGTPGWWDASAAGAGAESQDPDRPHGAGLGFEPVITGLTGAGAGWRRRGKRRADPAAWWRGRSGPDARGRLFPGRGPPTGRRHSRSSRGLPSVLGDHAFACRSGRDSVTAPSVRRMPGHWLAGSALRPGRSQHDRGRSTLDGTGAAGVVVLLMSSPKAG